MRLQIIFVSIVLLLTAGCATEQNADTATDADQPSSEQISGEQADADSLVQTLINYNKACQQGDIDAVRRHGATDRIQKMEKLLADRGEELTAQHLSGPCTTLTDPAQWTVTHAHQNKEHARIQLVLKDGADSGIDIASDSVAIALIVFRQEGGQWKFFAGTVHGFPRTVLQTDQSVPSEDIPQEIRMMLQYDGFSAGN